MTPLSLRHLAQSDQFIAALRDNFDPEEWVDIVRKVLLSPTLSRQEKEVVARLTQLGMLYLMQNLEN